MAVAVERETLQTPVSIEETKNGSGSPIRASGLEFYTHEDHSVWASGEDGAFMVVSARVDILEKLIHPETGAAWLRLEVVSARKPRREIFCPTAKGAAGIARRLLEIGEFVRFKPAVAYFEELLAQKWPSLETREMTWEEAMETDPESGLLLELLAEFVRDFEDKFDRENWGKIEETDQGTKVAILRPVMAEFFRRAKVPPEIQPAVLKKWRDDGRLEAGRDRKRLTKVTRVNGTPRRCYVILLPPLSEPEDETL